MSFKMSNYNYVTYNMVKVSQCTHVIIYMNHYNGNENQSQNHLKQGRHTVINTAIP